MNNWILGMLLGAAGIWGAQYTAAKYFEESYHGTVIIILLLEIILLLIIGTVIK